MILRNIISDYLFKDTFIKFCDSSKEKNHSMLTFLKYGHSGFVNPSHKMDNLNVQDLIVTAREKNG